MPTTEQEKAEKPDPLTIPNKRFEKFTHLTVEENKDFLKILDEISKKFQAIIEVIKEMDINNPVTQKFVKNLLDAIFDEQDELDKYLDVHDFKNALISSKKYLALLDMIIGDEVATLIQTLAKAHNLRIIAGNYRKKVQDD